MNQKTSNVQRQPPPGTVIIKSGIVQKGDWFYIEQLGAWGLVPKIGWGEPIRNSLIARGTLDESAVDMTRCSNDPSSPTAAGDAGGAERKNGN